MAHKLQARPGRQRLNDGSRDAVARAGSLAELVTSKMSGGVFEQVMRGNGYSFTTALAGNALIAPGTANAPAIWNPPNSGRLLSIIKVVFGRTAVGGTPLEGSLVYSRLQNVNSRLGAAADLVSGTAVAAVNLRSDMGDQSGMVFFPTTKSTTTAVALWACCGVAQTADDGDTTVNGPKTQRTVDQLDGLLCIGPGTLFTLAAAVTIVTTYTISIYGLSLPIPLSSN